VAGLDSIRILPYRVQIREENLYLLLTLLFSLYPIYV
jgi:aryl carrier-like protein